MASSLSNLAHKIGDKLEQRNAEKNTPGSTTHGHHNTTTPGHTAGHTTSPGVIGGSNTYGSTTNDPAYNNPQSTSAGPHGSNLANKLDPRVDSDRDGRNDPTSRTGGYGQTQTHHAGSGVGHTGAPSHFTSGSNTNDPAYNNPQSTAAGPHSSNLANKLDPRVDSDRDGRNDPTSRTGGYGQTQSHNVGHTGPSHYTSGHNTAGAGYTGGNTIDNDPRSTNVGPHSSNLANKLDPRVDSDRDGRNDPTSRTGGYGQTQTHNTGYGAPTHHDTTASHHGTHGGIGGPGGYTGSNTTNDPRSTNAGPHSSNLLNKLDPRVDSDRDGSNTSHTGGYGQTQSHGSGITGGTHVQHGPTTTTTTHTSHGVGGPGYSSTTQHYDNPRSENAGPHNSNLLNKLDPRVDSDRDGRNDPTSRTGGLGQTQDHGSYGYAGGPRY